MIAITDVKVINVDRDPLMITHLDDPFKMNWASFPDQVEYTHEVIYGEQFLNANDEVITIGMSKVVQDTIGLPMRVFKELTDRNVELNSLLNVISDRLYRRNAQLTMFYSATFWERIKYLFTGRL